jgi:hypothetical protein
MSELKGLPETDLHRLHEELLGGAPDAVLPRNLSPEWLALLNRDLSVALDDFGTDAIAAMRCTLPPLFLVLRILEVKHGRVIQVYELTQDEVVMLLYLYFMEISLEIPRREGRIDLTPATIETIFERYLPGMEGPTKAGLN